MSRSPHPDPAAPAGCARRILDTVPAVMRLVRGEVRGEMSSASGGALSVPQFRVLAYLGRCPDASLTAVAAHVGVADATASAMVERLVRRELVRREGDPVERRRVRLRLTRAGAALLRRAQGRTRRRMAARLTALPPAELAALARGLDVLRRALLTPAESNS